jgi:hypothetical protein
MHAVVTRATIHDLDQARQLLTDQGIPRLRQASGFVRGNWVALDESSGTGMIIFESEEAARAGAELVRANPPAGDAVTITSIGVGEVVGEA